MVNRDIERRGADVVRLVAALVVLLATCWLAARGVSTPEERVFDLFNRLPDWLEHALWLPMQLGSLFGPVVVAVVAWCAWRDWRPAVGALVVGVISWQLAKEVKDVIERGRPHSVLDEFIRRGGTPTEGLGFVSGHAAVSFGLAAVVAPYLGRKWWWTAYLAAGVVAVARIHVGAHFPLDVVGGAALGCGLGLVWRLVVGRPSMFDRASLSEPRWWRGRGWSGRSSSTSP